MGVSRLVRIARTDRRVDSSKSEIGPGAAVLRSLTQFQANPIVIPEMSFEVARYTHQERQEFVAVAVLVAATQWRSHLKLRGGASLEVRSKQREKQSAASRTYMEPR